MPINETATDRQREELALRKYEEYLRRTVGPVTVHRAPAGGLTACDAIIEIDSYLCFLEIKCRNVTREQYATYMISQRKMQNLQFIALKQTVGLLVHWTDCTGLYTITGRNLPIGVTIETGGRTDRKQKNDTEPCWLIPIDRFKIIEAA